MTVGSHVAVRGAGLATQREHQHTSELGVRLQQNPALGGNIDEAVVRGDHDERVGARHDVEEAGEGLVDSGQLVSGLLAADAMLVGNAVQLIPIGVREGGLTIGSEDPSHAVDAFLECGVGPDRSAATMSEIERGMRDAGRR